MPTPPSPKSEAGWSLSPALFAKVCSVLIPTAPPPPPTSGRPFLVCPLLFIPPNVLCVYGLNVGLLLNKTKSAPSLQELRSSKNGSSPC